jgi:hypothetical protein
VVIREDQALVIDQEAGAGAFPRPLAITVELSANEITCGASDAADTRAGRLVLGGADTAGAGVIEPATIRPTRNATTAVRQTVATRNRRVMAAL